MGVTCAVLFQVCHVHCCSLFTCLHAAGNAVAPRGDFAILSLDFGKLIASGAAWPEQADVLCALMLFWDEINFSKLILIHYMSLSSTNGPPRPISQTN